ncbi:MAG: M14 family zinc carboxypeptidase [Pyrinomonadaceae bacterium]
MKTRNLLFAILFALLLVQLSSGQTEEKFDFYSRGDYRPEVPRPQTILRFDVGEQHTTYAQMEMVINAIEKAASDRVKIFDIGLTQENRMQHIVAISSPENISRLEQIKTANARLTDPRAANPSQAASIIQNNPVIAWMAYTIHGNESASFETMMQVVYQLAASNEPATLEILKNTVVLIITGENPDGHERFVTWYNSVAVGDPNPASLEHNEPWSIWGRFNHYRFDLNRDNIALTQKETRNMNRAFMEWNPQVAVDHHGQPSQFFFPPAALPINPNLPQPTTNKWLDIYGRSNARAFDENKWTYYVRDIFDLFYPGYWDSFPALNGAIGMTYETDAGGFKGLRWRRDDGTIVTLRSGIAKHFVASMATLETTAKNRQSRLQDFYDFRKNAMAQATGLSLKKIIIVPEGDPNKAAELVEILRRSRVEVTVAGSSFRSTTAHSYLQKDAPREAKTFPAGSYIVDLNQPQSLWIKSLLEQDTPQDKEFVEDNMARFRRNERRGSSAGKEAYGFYDITSWSLPLAFGVEAYWTEDSGNAGETRVTDEYLERARRGNTNGRAQIAYVIPYQTDAAPVLALRLMEEGYRVNVSTRKLNAAGKNWDEGTFVVRVTRNPDGLHEAIARLSNELGVNVLAVNTSYTEEGDTGVGGENVLPLNAPKIAMVAGDAVNQTSYGSLWWIMDKYGIKFTPLSIDSIRSGALKDYNVLIMPDGSPGDYSGSLEKGGVDSLRDWISGGGTLITLRGASVFAALKDVGFTSSVLVGSGDDPEAGQSPPEEKQVFPTPVPGETPKPDKAQEIPTLPPITSPSANLGRVPEGVPGAIMRATVDRTTYLNYGVGTNQIPVLLASGYFFRYSRNGTNALVFDSNPKISLTISGFVWEGNTERLLKGTAYLIDEPIGRGHAILFADDVFFRGIFRSASRSFFNSVIFNGTF